jgi:EPS-associated MarR family transcriptional regulator
LAIEPIDTYYRMINIIEKNPYYTQRKIARELGYSLGKVNYVIASLVEKGVIKLQRFRESDNKRGYMYVLTKKGIRDKYLITKAFLRRKINEYKRITKEIAEAKKGLDDIDL